MAGLGRHTADDLKAALLTRAWQFEFWQAVRLLERLLPDRVPTGHSGPFRQEGLRFVPRTRLKPAANMLDRIRRLEESDDSAATFELLVACFGLYGLSAPGPAYVFEATADTAADRGQVLRAFLDVFNNRLTGLLYRTWLKPRWAHRFRTGGRDTLSRRAFSLVGLGSPWRRTGGEPKLLADHPGVAAVLPRPRLLRYAGLLYQRVRCPANLRGLLWDYFDGPDPRCDEFVEVEEFVPRWFRVDEARLCRLGRLNSRLGVARRPSTTHAGNHASDDQALAGQRIRERIGEFRVSLGPLDLSQFLAFLPIGRDYPALTALIDLYRPDRLDYQLRLRLRAAEVPPLQIGATCAARLGWSTWVGTPEVPRHREGVVAFLRHPARDRRLARSLGRTTAN